MQVRGTFQRWRAVPVFACPFACYLHVILLSDLGARATAGVRFSGAFHLVVSSCPLVRVCLSWWYSVPGAAGVVIAGGVPFLSLSLRLLSKGCDLVGYSTQHVILSPPCLNLYLSFLP